MVDHAIEIERYDPLVNLEAEMSVLGSALLSEAAFRHMIADLKPEMFYSPAHAEIFRAMQRLKSKGLACDFLTLKSEIGARILSVGGDDYLLQIAEVVPSASNAAHYAGLVKTAAFKRGVVERCKELVRSIVNGSIDASVIQAKCQSIGQAFAPGVSPVIDLADVDILDDRPSGYTTGFASLDATQRCGGYPVGEYTVVLGGTGGGKTTFMASSFYKLMAQGKRCLYVTVADMSANNIKRLLMRMHTGYGRRPTSDLVAAAEWDQANQDWVVNYDGHILDAFELENPTIEAIEAWVYAAHERNRYEYAFFDYIQEIETSDKRASEWQAQEYIGQRLLRLCKRCGFAGIIGSQITEGDKKSGRLPTTKGARKTEERAALKLLIEQDPDDKTRVDVKILKARYGKRLTTTLTWNEARLRYEDRA